MIRKELLSIDQVAKRFGVDRRTVKRLVECGDLDAINIYPSNSVNRRYLFIVDDVNRYINRSKKNNKK